MATIPSDPIERPTTRLRRLRITASRVATVDAEFTADATTTRVTPAPTLPCDAMLHEYRRGLVYFMRRESGNPTLAEDLCNEAFRITIARVNREPLDDPSKFAAYLLQTARNLLLRIKQKAATQQTVTGEQDAIEEFEDPDADPTINEDVKVWARIIHEVLSELSIVRDRKLLIRYYLNGEDKAKICRDLKISKRHFRRVNCRARQRCRALLERRYDKSDLL